MFRPKFDLNLLTCFQAVAEEGSISKAASVLHLSQPAISLQIKKLEEELGLKLFGRHNRGLVLTPLGKHLLGQVKQIMSSVEKVDELIHGFQNQPQGIIKVGTYTTASSYLIPKVMKNFFKKFPNLSLSFEYEQTNKLIEKIKNHELDCAVVSEVPHDPGLESEVFFRDELILATSTSNKKIPAQIAPKNLSTLDYLSYPLRMDLCYQAIEKKYGKYLKSCSVPVETISFDTLKQVLLSGVGATFMPSYMIQNELKTKKLRKISLGNQKIPIEFSFTVKKEGPLPRGVKEFKSHLFNHYKGSP